MNVLKFKALTPSAVDIGIVVKLTFSGVGLKTQDPGYN